MIKLSKSKGFTLVELMIVVAIMAILAAIAIPSYLRFQIKARESEMRINLASIRVCEEAYKAQNDMYQACGPSDALGANPTIPVAWGDSSGNFDKIGFEPDGKVRYVYSVINVSGATAYTAQAVGNVDGKDGTVTWSVDQDSAIPSDAPAGGH